MMILVGAIARVLVRISRWSALAQEHCVRGKDDILRLKKMKKTSDFSIVSYNC